MPRTWRCGSAPPQDLGRSFVRRRSICSRGNKLKSLRNGSETSLDIAEYALCAIERRFMSSRPRPSRIAAWNGISSARRRVSIRQCDQARSMGSRKMKISLCADCGADARQRRRPEEIDRRDVEAALAPSGGRAARTAAHNRTIPIHRLIVEKCKSCEPRAQFGMAEK